MYQYDEFDTQLLAQRIDQFRGQVRRRLRGELSEEQFEPLRLMNGLYTQRHAYMLRVNIPYGLLSSAQLRRLADIARRHDRGYGHFTTRQNLQYNWLRLEQIPDILEELAEVQMNSIQSSGNCVRNITSDPYAGRARDEIEDPRPWCEIIRQYSLLNPEFAYLPRKFKFAVTGSANDRAAVAVHDIGLRIHRNDAGQTGFEVIVGGGQGRSPVIGKTLRNWLEPAQLLAYIEAILRVYNLYGRRDNIYKARIKILVNAMGLEEFRRQVDAEWLAAGNHGASIPDAEIDRISAWFAPPAWEKLSDHDLQLRALRQQNPAFDTWLRTNISTHKAVGYAIVNLPLKAPGRPPGDLDAARMDAVADLADEYGFGEIRITHRQNLVLPDARKQDLFELWQALDALQLATPNIGLLSDMVACPGLDYCKLANTRSIPLALDIGQHFAGTEKLREAGLLSLNISGCMNACGHHHVGNIGILGVDKRGEEFFQLTLGGASDQNPALGERLGRAMPREHVPAAIETIVDSYLSHRLADEQFNETCRRIGLDVFRSAVYGPVTDARRSA